MEQGVTITDTNLSNIFKDIEEKFNKALDEIETISLGGTISDILKDSKNIKNNYLHDISNLDISSEVYKFKEWSNTAGRQGEMINGQFVKK